jgi:tRNA threonylcarbamoyladenosine biosynthesis protein TsaB
MKILAFETATEGCSVAVYVDGALRERFAVAPRQHATLALPWADELLAEAGIVRAQLDAIAVGIGPGAFTGVRLAVALAQGIALGLDRPVLPVSTLAVLALSGRPDDTDAGRDLVAAIDARMGEVYLGRVASDADGLVSARGAEVLVAPDAARADVPFDALGIGSGFAAAAGVLVARLGLVDIFPDALPHAAALARLAARDFIRGQAIAADALAPPYRRHRVAHPLV